MLLRVRTYHLNFSSAYLRSMSNADPSITSPSNGIDGIRNHSSPQAKVVLGDGIGDTIPRIIERFTHCLGIADGLLNRIYAHVHGTELASQLSGNRCLSGAR
jgi:hypothetical protein